MIKVAEQILDHIDPKRVFGTRLFREHCSVPPGAYYASDRTDKHLSRLGRDMRNVILVDDDDCEFILSFECDMQQINKSKIFRQNTLSA